MPYIVTVAFARPATGTYKFNMDYYLANHTTLAIKAFRPLGLQSLTVVDYRDDATQPYLITNVMEWDSVEEFEKQQGSESVQAVFADIVNVTDLPPIFLQGEVKKAWKADNMNLGFIY